MNYQEEILWAQECKRAREEMEAHWQKLADAQREARNFWTYVGIVGLMMGYIVLAEYLGWPIS